ncbi:MAG TPA: hypothetical protein VFV86_00965, partial [Nitrososphaeraceae archaeon]|nr:hypothetical protein [Nitrososphaeraceae archaeon]
IDAYRHIQRVAFEAKDNSQEFIQAIKDDSVLSKYFSEKELQTLFTPEKHFASGIQIIENASSIVKYGISS